MNLPDGKPILESHTWCPGCDESGVENASHYACKAVLEEIEKLKKALKEIIAIIEDGRTEPPGREDIFIHTIAKQVLGEEEG